MQDTKSPPSSDPAISLSQWHNWGGYTGLIPFFGLGALTLAGYDVARPALISYAALIFSFLCGVIWFVSLQRPQSGHIALVALGGMLWSWCWLLFPQLDWSAAAALSFAGLWLYEWRFLARDYGAAFLRLRLQLSAGAASALATVFLFS